MINQKQIKNQKELEKQEVIWYTEKYKMKMAGSTESTKKGWIEGIGYLNKESKDQILINLIGI